MNNHFKCTTIIKSPLLIVILVVTILALSGTHFCFADAQSFQVESYIPEKFIDMKWRVSGNINFTGNDSEHEEYASGIPTSISKDTKNKTDRQRLYLVNYYDYNYETIQRYLIFNSDLTIILNNTNYNSKHNEGSSSGDIGRTSSSKRDPKEYSIRINPQLDCGVYLHSDLYVSLLSEWQHYYTGKPNGRSESIGHAFYISGDTVYNDVSKSNRGEDDTNRNDGFSISIRPGWGRVYEGQFASTAMYIIDELRQNNLITLEPTYDQLYSLTEIIYQRRLIHKIDSRIHRIESIDKIVDYLIGEGIVNEYHPMSSIVIQDIWDYFPRTQRKFGFRIMAGPGISYEKNSSDYSYTQEQHSIRYEYPEDSPGSVDTTYQYESVTDMYEHQKVSSILPYLTAKAEYYRPINHRWQLNTYIDGKYYLNSYKERTAFRSHYNEFWKYEEDDFDNYELNFDVTILYILNSRTDFSFSYDFTFENIDYKRSTLQKAGSSPYQLKEIEEIHNSYWKYRLDFVGAYRIAVPTTLNFRAQYSAIDDKAETLDVRDDNRNSDGYSFSVSISHYLK